MKNTIGEVAPRYKLPTLLTHYHLKSIIFWSTPDRKEEFPKKVRNHYLWRGPDMSHRGLPEVINLKGAQSTSSYQPFYLPAQFSLLQSRSSNIHIPKIFIIIQRKLYKRLLISNHTLYLSFFLHGQNFWRIKFTPKNANFFALNL